MSKGSKKKSRRTTTTTTTSVPPEVAAHYLSQAASLTASTSILHSSHISSHSSNSNSSSIHNSPKKTPCSDAEMKALMNMFVEIMGMSSSSGGGPGGVGGDQPPVTSKNGMPVFMFGNSGTPWPPGAAANAAAAAAAAAAGIPMPTDANGTSIWGVDYFEEDDEDDDDDDEDEDDDDDDDDGNQVEDDRESSTDRQVRSNNNDNNVASSTGGKISPTEWASLERVAQDETLEEEEKAKRAAKKKEKKHRKKEKAKKEAALKAQEAALKKREKMILSWKSRVVSACQAGDSSKVDVLLSESPFKPNESVDAHMEFLLPNAIAKSRTQVEDGSDARQSLAAYILTVSTELVFTMGRNGRNALHTACFTGDYYFVQVVLPYCPSLDNTCLESGFAPLHYAVVAGSLKVVETLLKGGCNVKTCTDDAHTCRTSDGEGITARELAETILSGTHERTIETQGSTLQEITDQFLRKSTEKRQFLDVLKQIIRRLVDVETNGYSPLATADAEGDDEQEEVSHSHSSSTLEDVSKRKKKKKKKATAGESAPAVPSKASTAPAERQEDPVVAALMGMGFTTEQVMAAAKACGGAERATADDMVAWIFEQQQGGDGTGASNIEDTQNPARAENPSFVNVPVDDKIPTLEQSYAATTPTLDEEAEAEKREEEARIAAQRLAAKREEQRRRNREWNNRAEARQKEEAQAKLKQEMEARARAEAQRVAMERAAAQLPPYAGSGPTLVGYSGISTVAPVQQAASNPLSVSVPALGQTMLQNGMAPSMVHSKKPVSLINHSGSQVIPNRTQVPHQPTAIMKSMGVSSFPANHQLQNARARDVNTSDFPELGITDQWMDTAINRVSSSDSGKQTWNIEHAKVPPLVNAVSVRGPADDLISAPPPSHAPPGFRPPRAVSNNTGPELSHLKSFDGEKMTEADETISDIRATAKAFVPSNFKSPQGFSNTPAPASTATYPSPADGVSMPTNSSYISGLHGNQLVPFSNFQGDMRGLSHHDPLLAFLPTGIPGSQMSNSMDRPATVTPQSSHSPVPSAASSSVTGISGLDEPIFAGFGLNSHKSDYSMGSSLLDPISIATDSGSSSAATAVSAIWGGAFQTATPAVPTGFGGFSSLHYSDGSAPLGREPATGERINRQDSREPALYQAGWGSGDAIGGGKSGGNLGSIW